MLVLSRKAGEKITVDIGRGRSVVVTCLGRDGGQYRIGVEAPKDVLILRDELLLDDERERMAKR